MVRNTSKAWMWMGGEEEEEGAVEERRENDDVGDSM